ncbi:hypothetical protein F5Y17DRAFT_460498 [Xylariaceae sp. FL0594]|nr:hypothetical protein F5Y17DRAFT_460498 [Xylariaceae sp. FL0594]
MANFSLYDRYKEDTRLVAEWLDHISRACGFRSSESRQKHGESQNKHVVSIADFGATAEFLAVKGAFQVPSYVKSSLSRAIEYRSRYGTVQNTLARIPGHHTSDKEQAPAPSRFGSLHTPQPVEGGDGDEHDEPEPLRTSVSSTGSAGDVVFEPWREDKYEGFFEWDLFTVEVQRIRKEVRQLWELYRAGQLGLCGVATAHNAAIHLIRNMERDIKPVMETLGGYMTLSQVDFMLKYLRTAADQEELEDRISLLTANTKVAESLDAVDEAVACQIVTDSMILTQFLSPGYGLPLDELSIAIEDMVPWWLEYLSKHYGKKFRWRPNMVPFRAVFATQLLLDSVHILGTSIERPGKELVDKTTRIFKSAKSLRLFYEGQEAPALECIPGSSFCF